MSSPSDSYQIFLERLEKLAVSSGDPQWSSLLDDFKAARDGVQLQDISHTAAEAIMPKWFRAFDERQQYAIQDCVRYGDNPYGDVAHNLRMVVHRMNHLLNKQEREIDALTAKLALMDTEKIEPHVRPTDEPGTDLPKPPGVHEAGGRRDRPTSLPEPTPKGDNS